VVNNAVEAMNQAREILVNPRWNPRWD
jgi:hypothetical protein